MKVHAFTTGTVRITHNWKQGQGSYIGRLVRSLTDSRMTEPLPIWCFLIEHPEGLILVDTGIPLNANARVWFPPFMPLVQRAATFQIEHQGQEIGEQLRANGFFPDDVRWVILTHLHQDHEGGLQHFKNAEFVVSQAEYAAASGLKGRLAGYLNFRWGSHFKPTLIDFNESDAVFGRRQTLTKGKDVYLVPTTGHSDGHLSVILEEENHVVFFAGDASYTQALLLEDAVDGVGRDSQAQHTTHQSILQFAATTPTVYLPTHEWESKSRLEQREVIRTT